MRPDDGRPGLADAARALCEWAASVRAADIPDEVMVRAVRVLADDLSAIVGAHGEPEVRGVQDKLLARTAASEATVFRGGRTRTERTWAAVANAVAANWLELDEGYRLTPCHAGLYTLPALMAQAEATNLPLEDMLRSLVVGYEIVTRVARGFRQRAFNMQSHGRYCAIGAAAATALARDADAQQLHGVITAASTLVMASPRSHLVSGALVRNVWPAVGAWSGMMSAEWASCGITGVPSSLDDVYATVFGGEAQPDAVTKALGSSWAILDGYTKRFACCQHLHSALEALLDIREAVMAHGGPQAVQAIVVETHPLALVLDNPAPLTTLGAKFSMPHAMGAALLTGTGGADAFLSGTLHDPVIRMLRERVSVRPFAPLPDPPNDRPARVQVTLRDGTRLDGECLSAQGGSDRPFPPSMLEEKVHALSAGVYPKLHATLFALADPVRARSRRGWGDIVGDFCS
ncbi:MAG: MmgE/PrpD family protein [Lautropia sp.]